MKALTGAGFDAKQAETITNTVREAIAEGVATKADIARLEDRMATKADLARLEAHLTVRFYGALLAAVAAVVALIKLLP